ncbi:hypothetical protein [Tunturiibacter gelidiferens]|uniref:hypothetical protein n=1 Tax=Tunturiibacter gelidiferens TaxID=3069689 RepID=UPI003D9B9D64
MTMCASKIGTVPTIGFDWYIVLLEGPFGDAIREQIDKYFMTLGKEAGPDILVVRGYDATAFRDSFESAALYSRSFDVPDDWKSTFLPAIVVTDALPTAIKTPNGLDQAKVMIFPLREIYKKHNDISIFFGKLLAALHSNKASYALDRLDESEIEREWSWMREYVEMKPGFFGFKFDLGKMIAGILAKAR